VSEPASDAGSPRTRVRAIVLHPSQPAAWLLPRSDGPVVPEFELPGRSWPGDASVFVRAVRDGLGLDVRLLRGVDERTGDDQVHRTTLVFVLRDAAGPVPPDGRWLGVGEAAGLADVAAVLGELAAGRTPVGRPPWRVRDWFGPAEEWIITSLSALGRAASGPIEQIRSAELSCVLRAPTADGDVYFKATARLPLFVDEGRVMATLSDLLPGHVPAPLAFDSQRRWMLLPDVGPKIGRDAPVEVRLDVIRTFARLQIRSAGSVDQLLAAGCFDRTPPWLARQATTGWLATVDLSRWLTGDEAAELRSAGTDLARRCAELSTLPVPCTVVHGDMHLGNVARGADGYVFFDWSDACVTHPFVDMIEIVLEDDATHRERLRDGYLAEWAWFAPPAQLLRAWRLAEPLISFNQAISYASIESQQEAGTDRDSFSEETARWMRKLLDGCRRSPP